METPTNNSPAAPARDPLWIGLPTAAMLLASGGLLVPLVLAVHHLAMPILKTRMERNILKGVTALFLAISFCSIVVALFGLYSRYRHRAPWRIHEGS